MHQINLTQFKNRLYQVIFVNLMVKSSEARVNGLQPHSQRQILDP